MDKVIFKEDIIVKETKYFSVEQDWEIPIPGFFVIMSKRNIKSILDFTNTEGEDFIGLLKKVRKGMKDILNINEVYLFQNEDSKRPFHVWIFPRYSWMDKIGRKIQSVRPIMDYAKANMINEKTIKEVKESINKMRSYM